jgi:hypothetical protein
MRSAKNQQNERFPRISITVGKGIAAMACGKQVQNHLCTALVTAVGYHVLAIERE